MTCKRAYVHIDICNNVDICTRKCLVLRVWNAVGAGDLLEYMYMNILKEYMNMKLLSLKKQTSQTDSYLIEM